MKPNYLVIPPHRPGTAVTNLPLYSEKENDCPWKYVGPALGVSLQYKRLAKHNPSRRIPKTYKIRKSIYLFPDLSEKWVQKQEKKKDETSAQSQTTQMSHVVNVIDAVVIEWPYKIQNLELHIVNSATQGVNVTQLLGSWWLAKIVYSLNFLITIDLRRGYHVKAVFWRRLTRPFCQYLGHVSSNAKSLCLFR